MDLAATVSEVIDLRSFSNLWFWIAVAVMWSTASHWVLGVPWDLVQRARHGNGTAAAHVHQLARIHCDRLLHIGRNAGVWLVGLVSGAVTTLALLALLYENEFAQALLCLFLPMTLVGGLSLHTASRIDAGGVEGPALYRLLASHRRWVQMLGVISIFVTAVWGMYQNVRIGVI